MAAVLLSLLLTVGANAQKNPNPAVSDPALKAALATMRSGYDHDLSALQVKEAAEIAAVKATAGLSDQQRKDQLSAIYKNYGTQRRVLLLDYLKRRKALIHDRFRPGKK